MSHGDINRVKDAALAFILSRIAAWRRTAIVLVAAVGLASLAACGNEKIGLDRCKLPIADGRGDVAVGGWPRVEHRMRSTGSITATVILVDFPDAPATISPAAAVAKLKQAEAIFSEMSYGRMEFRLTPKLRWYRMSKNSNEYQFAASFDSHRKYIAEAVALADPEVDFSTTDSLIILANPDAEGVGNQGPAFTPTDTSDGLEVDGNVIMNGATSAYDLNYWGAIWLNHEIGHTLGLVDLYAFEGEPFKFVGEYSFMSLSSLDANSPGLLAWERWVLGWIDDTQIVCADRMVDGGVRAVLTPVSEIGGVKAVVVPIAETRAVVVESRAPSGIDARIAKPGALVYVVDSAIESGKGPIYIAPRDVNDPGFRQSTRAVGQSVEIEGVRVAVSALTADGLEVEVTR